MKNKVKKEMKAWASMAGLQPDRIGTHERRVNDERVFHLTISEKKSDALKIDSKAIPVTIYYEIKPVARTRTKSAKRPKPHPTSI